MISSGTTAIATASDTAVTLLTINQTVRRITIINEGSVAGFFSIDSGTVWARLPAGPSSVTIEVPETPITNRTVQIKRESGGSNVEDVYGFAS